MIKEFEAILERLDKPTAEMFLELGSLVHESVDAKVYEKVWQNAALYYVDGGADFKPFSNCRHNKSVHILPFKGHISIYAPEAMPNYYDKLTDYKITPKAGMLQIFTRQPIPKDMLKAIFKEQLI